MSYKQVSPIPINEGGTNTRSFPFDHGVLVYEAGTQISINPGTAGHVLTSNGPALPPTFQINPADGIITLAADVGSATGATVTIAGGSNIDTSAAAATLTVDLVNSPSVSGSLTAGSGLIATAGGITSQGIALINASAVDFATTIGNNTGVSTMIIKSGSGGMTLTTSAGGFFLNTTGGEGINIGTAGAGSGAINIGTTSKNRIISILSGTSALNISTDANATTVSLATGAAAKALTIGSTNTTSSVTINTGSGGITIPSFTTTGAVVINASGVASDANASTAGFVLTSNGAGSAPSFQSIPQSFTWNNVTGASQAMSVANGYVDNGSGIPTVYTLPATGAVGDMVAIQGSGAGLWQIAQNAGQTIHFNAGNSTTGIGGTISSSSQYDSIYLMCNIANTDWVFHNGSGNYNVV